MTVNQIGSICHFAYSIPDHSVPSGGALYPLRIYVLIEKPQDGLEPGYYEYDAEQNRLVCFNDEVDVEQLKYCFNQEEMPFGSSVQIVIAANLERQPYKYANRGYRLTLIEVGHVAENIMPRTRMKQEETMLLPGFVLMICRAGRTVSAVE